MLLNVQCLYTIVIVLSDKPQPSHEYPLVLFSGVGYDSVSDNGYYKRLKENEFIVWGRTIADQQREFRYRSMIVMPGRKLSFKGIISTYYALSLCACNVIRKDGI